MISVEKFDLSISIGDRVIGQKPDDVFISLTIYENSNKGIPVAEIQFSCSDSADSIVDGMPVDIALSLKNQKKTVWKMPFRVFSHKIVSVGEYNSSVFQITAIFRSVTLLSSTSLSIKGTSGDAFKKFCSSDSSLTVETDKTNDSQIWRCCGERGFVFLQKIAKRAWSNDTSCFVTAFTKTGRVRLFDLSFRQNASPVFSFMPNTSDYGYLAFGLTENSILYNDLDLEFVPGILNYVHSYNSTWVNYSLNLGRYQVSNPKKVAASSETILINSMYLEKSRREMLPIDVGNVHPAYYKAEAQNSRFRMLYSVGVRVVISEVDFMRDLNLLDRVSLSVVKFPEKLNRLYSGNYFVEKCVTSVEGSNIKQIFLLTREGIGRVPSQKQRNQ